MIRPSIYLLLWLLGAVLIAEAFNLFHASTDLHRMYPFNTGIQISFQAWADYGCTRIAFSMIFFAIFWYSTKYTGQLFIIWLMSALYVIDYFLTYNGQIQFGHVVFRFTVIRIILFTFIIIKTIKDEWT